MGILNPTGYKKKVLNLNYRNISGEYFGEDYAWTKTTISQILKNRVYIGDMVQSKEKVLSYKIHKVIKNPMEEWIIVENTHEPIIERDTFWKIQDTLFTRDTKVEKDGNLSIFSGHIRCADCKRAMNKKSLSNKNRNRDYWYYVCPTYRFKSKDMCKSHSIRNDKLENAVLEAIKLQTKLIIEMEKLMQKINESKVVNLKNENIENSIKRQELELEKYNKLKKSVYEDWKLGIISQDDYFKYAKSYENNIKEIESMLNHLYKEYSNYQNQVKSENTWAENFKKNKNITKLTKAIIDELIDCIYVHESGDITIEFKYKDEFENALNFIKENEELTQKTLKAM